MSAGRERNCQGRTSGSLRGGGKCGDKKCEKAHRTRPGRKGWADETGRRDGGKKGPKSWEKSNADRMQAESQQEGKDKQTGERESLTAQGGSRNIRGRVADGTPARARKSSLS